jgi:hypothetical protein
MRKLAVFLTLAMLFMVSLSGQTNRTVTGKVADKMKLQMNYGKLQLTTFVCNLI